MIHFEFGPQKIVAGFPKQKYILFMQTFLLVVERNNGWLSQFVQRPWMWTAYTGSCGRFEGRT